MSFLPGLGNAVSKAYTVLDDIVDATEKGLDVAHLLAEFLTCVKVIFAHGEKSQPGTILKANHLASELDPVTVVDGAIPAGRSIETFGEIVSDPAKVISLPASLGDDRAALGLDPRA